MSDKDPKQTPDVALIATALRDCAERLSHAKPNERPIGYASSDLCQQADRLETWAAEICDALEKTATIAISYLPPSNDRSPRDAIAEVTTLVDTHPAFRGWQPLSAVGIGDRSGREESSPSGRFQEADPGSIELPTTQK